MERRAITLKEDGLNFDKTMDTFGGPTKEYKEERRKRKEALILLLSTGMPIGRVCKEVNITLTTFYQWLKEEEDLHFAFRSGEKSKVIVVEDSLFVNALKGNVTAQIFFLCNRAKDRWQNVNKSEHSGSIEHKIVRSDKELADAITRITAVSKTAIALPKYTGDS